MHYCALFSILQLLKPLKYLNHHYKYYSYYRNISTILEFYKHAFTNAECNIQCNSIKIDLSEINHVEYTQKNN